MIFVNKIFIKIFYYFLIIMFSFLLVEVCKTTTLQSFIMGICIGIIADIYILPTVNFYTRS